MKGEGPNASVARLKDMHVLTLKRPYLKIECAVNIVYECEWYSCLKPTIGWLHISIHVKYKIGEGIPIGDISAYKAKCLLFHFSEPSCAHRTGLGFVCPNISAFGP